MKLQQMLKYLNLTYHSVNMYQLLNEASERIPNFSGMKFTSFDLVDLGRCADKFQDTLSLCYGKDEVGFL